jgi:16S rRNA processing protein RimM
VTRPEPRLLALDVRVSLGGRSTRIVRRAGTDARPILRVEGCDTREAAEALRGTPLLVAAADAPALEEDEYWAHELVGCAVVDGSREVGVVAGLIALPSCEVLEVARADGAGELLVPLVRDAVRGVDVAGRRVDVDLGFLGEP